MIDTLIDIDTQALLFLNSLHADFFDRFMMFFTGRWVWIPMYASMLYVLWRMMTPRQLLVFVVGVALAITLSDQMVASVLRPIFERLRPANIENPISPLVHIVDGYRGGRYGFPSCHGANSFALAMFMALTVRRRRFVWFIYAWAIINCYTRIYLGVHYPGDILTGAAIGTLFGWLCYLGATRVSGFNARMSFKLSERELFPASHGAVLSRLVVSDVTIMTGLVTLAAIIVAALC